MATAPQTLTLEVDFASDPITGKLIDEHGTRLFSGWLELATAIQRVVDAVEHDAP